MSDDERFNLLKAHFGSEDEADQLNLEEFAALPDQRVATLVGRIRSVKSAGEISAIRERAIQAKRSGKD